MHGELFLVTSRPEAGKLRRRRRARPSPDRARRAHKILVFHHAQQVAPHIGRDGPRIDGLLHRVRHRGQGRAHRQGSPLHTDRPAFCRPSGGRSACQSAPVSLRARSAPSRHRPPAMVAWPQRSNLTVQREPAQVPALAGFSQIGRLGEVVLPRDALEHFIAVGAVEHTDRRGIS